MSGRASSPGGKDDDQLRTSSLGREGMAAYRRPIATVEPPNIRGAETLDRPDFACLLRPIGRVQLYTFYSPSIANVFFYIGVSASGGWSLALQGLYFVAAMTVIRLILVFHCFCWMPMRFSLAPTRAFPRAIPDLPLPGVR
jgi:hypothetical protein